MAVYFSENLHNYIKNSLLGWKILEKICVNTKKYILFWIFMLPIVFLFAYLMTFAEFEGGEIFLPLNLTGLWFFVIGFFGLQELYMQIRYIKKYCFYFLDEKVRIELVLDDEIEREYLIERENLESFKISYVRTIGVNTKLVFTLKNKEIISISEDFGDDERVVTDAFWKHSFFPLFRQNNQISNSKNIFALFAIYITKWTII